MPRTNIIEKTEAEALAESSGKFFRPAHAETPAIPAAFDGKYVQLVAVVTDVELDDAAMDALETAIQELAGVQRAFVLIGSARIPVDRTPADHDLVAGVDMAFDIRPTPQA